MGRPRPAPVPGGPGDSIPLVVHRIQADTQFILRMCGDTVRGCWTHWDRGRSYYCGPKCRGPRHAIEPQWKGYVAAERWYHPTKRWYPCVLELTSNAELEMRPQFCRGSIWVLNRGPDVNRRPAPVHATLTEILDPSAWPRDFDILPPIRAVYNERDIVLNVPNPAEPKITVAASNGAPPQVVQDVLRAATPDAAQLQDARDRVRQEVRDGLNGRAPSSVRYY